METITTKGKEFRSLLSSTKFLHYVAGDADIRISGQAWAMDPNGLGFVKIEATFFEGEFVYSPMPEIGGTQNNYGLQKTKYICSLDMGFNSILVNLSCNRDAASRGYGRLVMNLAIQIMKMCCDPDTSVYGNVGHKDSLDNTSREAHFWKSVGAKYGKDEIHGYVEDLIIRESANSKLATVGGVSFSLPLSEFVPCNDQLFQIPAKQILSIPARGMLNQLAEARDSLQERSDHYTSSLTFLIQKFLLLSPKNPYFTATNDAYQHISDSLKFELKQFPFIQYYINYFMMRFQAGDPCITPWGPLYFEKNYTSIYDALNAILNIQIQLEKEGYK